MDYLEKLHCLLDASIKEIDRIENVDDYICGLRMGYLQLLGIVCKMKYSIIDNDVKK